MQGWACSGSSLGGQCGFLCQLKTENIPYKGGKMRVENLGFWVKKPETEALFLLYAEPHGEDLPHIETNYAVHLANEFLGSTYPQYQV